MGADTKIPWARHTFNPWLGCAKVSPGCDHCYAEGWAKRSGLVEWGAGKPRRRTTEATWAKPLKWNREAREKGIRYRVFCASLGDVFDPEVPGEWRDELWALIWSTPNLDWLLLTKRPERMRPYFTADLLGRLERRLQPSLDRGGPAILTWPLPNVWLGVTAENQEQADKRIPILLLTPAAGRFVSIEPGLGPVDLYRGGFSFLERLKSPTGKQYERLDWVIVGCESGPKRRPFDEDWARSLRDQCQAAGIPFFYKQGPGGPPPKGIIETPFLDGIQHMETPE